MRRKDSSLRPGCALRLSFALRYSWSSATHSSATHSLRILKHAIGHVQTYNSNTVAILAHDFYAKASLEHSGILRA